MENHGQATAYSVNAEPRSPIDRQTTKYQLYSWRFPGAFSLVVFSFVTGLIYPWFGAISEQAARELHVSVRRINWLGISLNVVFLPVSLATPFFCSRYGLRNACLFGAVCLVLGTWIRFIGVSRHHKNDYGIIVIGQLILGIAEPIFLIVGPKFSQAWFDFDGRTTVTMLVSVANPVGAGLGQILPSILGSTRHSVLILGIICTVISPLALLIYSNPPTPPTFSGAQPSPEPIDTLRALFGVPVNKKGLPFRTRLDFFIICYAFAIYVGAVNGFALLTGQLFRPYGFSDTQSGLFGACLLLTGLAASAVTSPLFDRVFTKHITISIKVCIFILSGAWLSLIWAIRPHDRAGIFVTVTAIGSTSLTLLPLALELGCDLLEDPETSSAILWCLGNLSTIIFVLVEGALVDNSPSASPHGNLHKATIFAGVMACSAGLFGCVGLKGLKNSRRELDAQREQELRNNSKAEIPLTSVRHSIASNSSTQSLPMTMPAQV